MCIRDRVSPTVGDALKFFYTLLSVSLFVPVVAGLASKRAGAFEVIAAVLCGVTATAAVQLGLAARLPPGITAAVVGLVVSGAVWVIVSAARRA